MPHRLIDHHRSLQIEERRLVDILAIEKLQVAYGKVPALWDGTLEVPDGEIVAPVGANDAGKTPLLKTVSGLLRRQPGSIIYDGKHIEATSPPEIVRQGVVHVPEGRKLFPEMTAIENLLMAPYPFLSRSAHKDWNGFLAYFPCLKNARNKLPGHCPEESSKWWRSVEA